MADELVLLALGSDYEGWPLRSDGTPNTPPYLGPGVGVALLAELAVTGAITVDEGRVVAGPVTIGGSGELRSVASRIAEQPRHRSAAWWAQRLAAERPDLRRLEALKQRNLILEYERVARRVWRTGPGRYWFVPENSSTLNLIVGRLKRAMHAGEADGWTAALLAIVHACGVHRAYFRNLNRRERERRIRRIADKHWSHRAAASAVTARNLV